jgi:hypothetical protein
MSSIRTTADSSKNDLQAARTLTMLRENVHGLIQAEQQANTTPASAEKLKHFTNCLDLLNSTFAQLKKAERPAKELAECQYQLADLYTQCPHLYAQAFSNNPKRLISGMTHCANTIRFAREVKEVELRNNLIVHSIIKLTSLLSDNQAAQALDLQGPQKKEFLSKLHGHITKGLEALEVSDDLSLQGKERITAATQPLLNLIQKIISPAAAAPSPHTRFSLFRKPLLLAGGAFGLYLGYASGGLLNTALLTALWGAAGAKTGEAADALAENCKRKTL